MSAVSEIFTWWAARMAELVPERVRRGDLPASALIADAQPGDPAIHLSQRRGRHETPVHQPPANAGRPKPTVLRIPAAAVLERTLLLPLAAEPELARVVAYEIDRISPFASAEVASAYHVEKRDRTAARLHVRVGLLPRLSIRPAIETLTSMGLAAPGTVLAPRSTGGLWRIRLAASAAPQPTAWQRPALLTAATACALLAMAAIATPFVLQQLALDQADAAATRLRPAVDEAAQLRRRIADRTTGVDAFAAETARVGQALGLLASLTGLLPDDTYLTTLAIRQRVLTMSGRTTSAARLIPLLAADPAIRNAAFAAPVTRAEGARGDVFSIRAEFRP